MRNIPRRIYQRLSGAHRPAGAGDSAAAARRLKALTYGATGGLIGAMAGAFAGGLVGLVLGAVLGYAAVYFFAVAVSEGGGAVMGQIHNPSGESVPHRREYSEPKALVLRGLFQEAIDSYQTYVAEFPDDPEPCIAIARIYRDHIRRYEDAVQWLRRARQVPGIDRGREIFLTREIIEVYQGKLNDPRRALPELARLADRFAGTREGDLAKSELAELRQALGDQNPA